MTLHHFTDPLWLQPKGAGRIPHVGDYFARFVTRVVEALGDQVTFWCTINEPIVYAYSGYLVGNFPAGCQNTRFALFNVLRRMLLVHGRIYRLIHSLQNNAEVGLAHNMQVMLPANPDSAADRRAAAMRGSRRQPLGLHGHHQRAAAVPAWLRPAVPRS